MTGVQTCALPIPLATGLQQINRSREQPSAFPPPDLEQVIMFQSKAETDQESEQTVERALDGARLVEGRCAGVSRHASILSNRSHEGCKVPVVLRGARL